MRILGVNRDAEPAEERRRKRESAKGFGARRLQCAGGGGTGRRGLFFSLLIGKGKGQGGGEEEMRDEGEGGGI